MERKQVLPFALLATVPFIMVLGNSMLIPVFPQLEKSLELTQFQVGLIVTAFSIPAGLVIPFAGAFSDHVGRKPILFPALLLYGLGGLIAGTAAWLLKSPFAWIMVGRVVQGIGAGGTYQIALALTGDMFQQGTRTKAASILEAANGLGKVISPVAGAALGMLVWFAPFFAYGLLAIPIAFAVWFLVEEGSDDRPKQSAKQYMSSLADIFRSKGVPLLCVYVAGAVGLFLLFGLLSYISDELEARHGFTGIVKGLILAIPVLVMTVTTFIGGIVLQDRNGWLTPAIITGLGLTVGGFVGLAFMPGVVALVSWASAIGLGIGMQLPALNTYVINATDTASRGIITALYGTVRFFGVALGPPAFGLVQGIGRLPIFLAGAALAAVTLALAAIFVRANRLFVNGGQEQQQTKSRPPAPEKSHMASQQFAPPSPRRRERLLLDGCDHDPF